jgi:large subunit ribosomal protein L4
VTVEAEERTALTVDVYSGAGRRTAELDLPASAFGIVPNLAVMHQAYLRQLANNRQGTAATKTRADVRGGGSKPYRQKGTGRSRHGSIREPSMVGGGTVFGPHPRSYRLDMPRKMRRLALRSALSVKAQEHKVLVLDGFDLEEPSTVEVAELLRAVGVEQTALLVLAASNLVVQRSLSNLPWAKAVLWSNLNLYDLFTHELLIVQKDALEQLDETFGAATDRPYEVEAAMRAVELQEEEEEEEEEEPEAGLETEEEEAQTDAEDGDAPAQAEALETGEAVDEAETGAEAGGEEMAEPADAEGRTPRTEDEGGRQR